MNELLALNQIELEKRKSSQQPNVYFQTGNAYLQLGYCLEAEAWFIRGLLFGDNNCANKLGDLYNKKESYEKIYSNINDTSESDSLFSAMFYKLAKSGEPNEKSNEPDNKTPDSNISNNIIHNTIMPAIYNKRLDKIFNFLSEGIKSYGHELYGHNICVLKTLNVIPSFENLYFPSTWWYLQSAQLDNAEACYQLGLIFENAETYYQYSNIIDSEVERSSKSYKEHLRYDLELAYNFYRLARAWNENDKNLEKELKERQKAIKEKEGFFKKESNLVPLKNIMNDVKDELPLFILNMAKHYNEQSYGYSGFSDALWWYERASLMGCPEASLWLAEQYCTGEVKVKKYNYELKFFNASLALAQNYKNKSQLEKFTYYIDLILKNCSKDISDKSFHDAITLWCGIEVLEGYELFEQLVKYRFGLPGIAPTFVKQEQNTKLEEKILKRKLIVEKETTISDIIKLDNIALHKAIALIENQSLQAKLYKLLERSMKKLLILNNDILSTIVFSKERDAHIRMLQGEVKEIVESDEYIEFDKTLAVEQILPDLIYPFWSCRPFLKIETEIEREQNIVKEQRLFNEQKAIRRQPMFIQALSKFKEERKNKQSSKPKVYFLYARPMECYVQRESWIHEFLTNLRRDLKQAGIEAILDREDNFSGNNLMQFMGQILQDNCIVLVFGTESFRHKWFSHKMALQIEGELLKLKWLTDFSEGKIKHNQGTTIIPFVITGIRETAIPEDLLPAKNPMVRALYNLSYKTILSSILAAAYGITEKTVKKIISGINDLTEELNQPIRSEPTNYSNIQQQTLFGAENNQTRNNNTIATSAPLENFVKSNTNSPN